MSVRDDLGSLARILKGREERDPDRIAFVWVRDDGTEEVVSYGDVHAGACAWSRAWADAGVGAGDLVVISLDHGRDLTEAFWGAVYRGAAPAYSSSCQAPVFDVERHARQIAELATRAGAVAVAERTEHAGAVRSAFGQGATRVATPTDAVKHAGAPFPALQSHGEEIACVQFTSGSTGRQKGVVLSHRAVIRCMQDLEKVLRCDHDDVIVNWMPLYHDFGLFFGMILGAHCGSRLVAYSPSHWVRDPLVQLRAITRHRGTISFLPNFGLNLLARRARDCDLAEFDLASVRALCVGGEPVIDASLELFAARFAKCGFRHEAFTVGWGMAESTCVASVGEAMQRPLTDWIDAKALQERGEAVPVPRNSPGARAIVSCGPPTPGAVVVACDEAGSHLPERRVGELRVRTDLRMSGYLDQPEETARVLVDGWYRSGDLGYLADGQVYLCGRVKDLIIVGGRNVDPVEIETLAGGIPELAPGRVVAFGVPDAERGTEKIVLVCGLREPVSDSQRWDIERELRHLVGRELELTLGDVRLVERSWVVKTHNGKMARGANREKYQAAELQRTES